MCVLSSYYYVNVFIFCNVKVCIIDYAERVAIDRFQRKKSDPSVIVFSESCHFPHSTQFFKSKNDTWPAGLVIHLNLHPTVDDDLISILGQKRFQMRAREP